MAFFLNAVAGIGSLLWWMVEKFFPYIVTITNLVPLLWSPGYLGPCPEDDLNGEIPVY